MKPTKDWFALLPEPYRSQAVENAIKEELEVNRESLSDAVRYSFYWNGTPQGFNHWDYVCNKFGNLTFPAEGEMYVNVYDDGSGSSALCKIFNNKEDAINRRYDNVTTYRLTKVEK